MKEWKEGDRFISTTHTDGGRKAGEMCTIVEILGKIWFKYKCSEGEKVGRIYSDEMVDPFPITHWNLHSTNNVDMSEIRVKGSPIMPIDTIYCHCDSNNTMLNSAYGNVFTYCKDCKKERQ